MIRFDPLTAGLRQTVCLARRANVMATGLGCLDIPNESHFFFLSSSYYLSTDAYYREIQVRAITRCPY
jgi:hypothetical protein